MNQRTNILIELWKETRTSLNHFDEMMDKGRQRAFLIFATITSIAAALHYTIPGVCLFNLRLSALLEICAILSVLPFFIQNRLYHNWLRKSAITAIKLEKELSKEEKLEGILLTIKLTQDYAELLKKEEKCYWKTMINSKLFWFEVSLLVLLLAIGIFLIFSFQFSIFL